MLIIKSSTAIRLEHYYLHTISNLFFYTSIANAITFILVFYIKDE